MKHFDRDAETNEVLWFAGPPMNMARVPAPRHSLAYLHYLAMKRKRGAAQADDMDVDGESSNKRRNVPPSMTEVLQAALKDVPL